MRDLRFLFQQRRNSKIGLCDDLVLPIYYTIKKIIISILSHNEEKPARANGMFRKTKNEIFDAVSVFIRNKSAY